MQQDTAVWKWPLGWRTVPTLLRIARSAGHGRTARGQPSSRIAPTTAAHHMAPHEQYQRAKPSPHAAMGALHEAAAELRHWAVLASSRSMATPVKSLMLSAALQGVHDAAGMTSTHPTHGLQPGAAHG